MILWMFMCEYRTGLGGLAQATVTGLPTDPAQSAKVTEIPKVSPGLPPHTVPGQDFGKQVGLLIMLIVKWNTLLLAAHTVHFMQICAFPNTNKNFKRLLDFFYEYMSSEYTVNKVYLYMSLTIYC